MSEHICTKCQCTVFTLVQHRGTKIVECMQCGSQEKPIRTGIDRNPLPFKGDRPSKPTPIEHWERKRMEWLNEWNKSIGIVGRNRSRR